MAKDKPKVHLLELQDEINKTKTLSKENNMPKFMKQSII